jgi:hypothetical protein
MFVNQLLIDNNKLLKHIDRLAVKRSSTSCNSLADINSLDLQSHGWVIACLE